MSYPEQTKAPALSETELESSEVRRVGPRLVYTEAPIQLGRLVRSTEQGWVVRVGGTEMNAAPDNGVDHLLLQQCLERNSPVLIESGHPPLIVGALATQRTLEIDPQGRVEAHVDSFAIHAQKELMLRAASSFLRLRGGEIESFAGEVVTRARNTVRILGALIRMN